ncbi:RNA-guided endonuclease IscB [Leptothoe sp. EHU-05/26/07-4]
MSNFAFLTDQNKSQMMPVHPKQARKLLEAGKASVFRRYPFTLILKREVQDIIVHPLTLKIDPGSKVTGFALVTDRGEVVWRMQLEHRGFQISERLTHRAQMRRHRRSNLRYRKPGLPNQKKPKGWLAPSLMHRVQTTETWVKRVCKFCLVKEIWIERVKFDTQLMQNPEVSGVDYQQGTLQGYTVREYLLEKWGRQCAYCGKTDTALEIEHIHPKSKGGSNRVSNLTLACNRCNQSKGNRDVEDFLKRRKGGTAILERVLKKAKQPLRDTAAVNATRFNICDTLTAHKPVETFAGAQTKMNRIALGMPKKDPKNDPLNNHCIDAACIGETPVLELASTKPLLVKCVGFGGRQRCQTDKYGYPVKHRPLRPIHGYQSGDIVTVNNPKGKNQGLHTGKLYPYSGADKRGEIIIGKRRMGVSLKNIIKVNHRKDGYTYA